MKEEKRIASKAQQLKITEVLKIITYKYLISTFYQLSSYYAAKDKK